MIEETVFTNETIVKIIKEIYGIDIFEIEKINRGSANVYSLNKNKYILKEFQSKYSEEEIKKEIAVINHLNKFNMNVPKYIETLSGEYSFIYNEKVVIMQKYIEGYTVESNTGNYNQLMESARELGKIIRCLETLDVELPYNDVSSWYKISKFDKSIEKYNCLLSKVEGEYFGKIKKDLEEKISMIEYVKDNLNFEEMGKLTYKNTHGDYNALQFIYKEGKIEAIIDFVSACKMPIVWEIIRSYSYIDEKAKNGKIDINNLTDYVKEFVKYVDLNEYDIKYMSYLYLIQILNSDYGYKQYIEDNRKIELLNFGFFRTELCRCLFEKSGEIAEKIGKIV